MAAFAGAAGWMRDVSAGEFAFGAAKRADERDCEHSASSRGLHEWAKKGAR